MAPKARLAAGAEVVVLIPDALPGLEPEPVPFGVVYEDGAVAVVDKPAGLVVHPGAGNRQGTLAAGLLDRWPELRGVGDEDRWGIVHRLDKDTSGLLVVAKTAEALGRLQSLLRRGKVHRSYLALVAGTFRIPTGTVDAPLGREPRRPTRVAVRSDGRPAVTHYRRLAEWPREGVSLVEVELETGRTHQIRVHLRAIDHPVIGDPAYGTRTTHPIDPGRVWLHAARLRFPHPLDDSDIDARSPLPDDLRRSLAALGEPEVGGLPPPV